MLANHPAVRLAAERSDRWSRRLSWQRNRAHAPRMIVEGKLARVAGLTLEAVGCEAALGARCRIQGNGGSAVEAEVVGFAARV